MSIKSDKWIKKMSTNEGMIKPFVEKQEYKIREMKMDGFSKETIEEMR